MSALHEHLTAAIVVYVFEDGEENVDPNISDRLLHSLLLPIDDQDHD